MKVWDTRLDIETGFLVIKSVVTRNLTTKGLLRQNIAYYHATGVTRDRDGYFGSCIRHFGP